MPPDRQPPPGAKLREAAERWIDRCLSRTEPWTHEEEISALAEVLLGVRRAALAEAAILAKRARRMTVCSTDGELLSALEERIRSLSDGTDR